MGRHHDRRPGGVDLPEELEDSARRAVVVGAGYIGVEMAEAMLTRGLEVTVVDRAPEPFTQIDPDMGSLVRTAMEGMGITVLTGTAVEGFDTGEDGRVAAVRTADGAIAADIVVLGLGVKPNVELGREAGLQVGQSGGYVTDVRMRGYTLVGLALEELVSTRLPALVDEHFPESTD